MESKTNRSGIVKFAARIENGLYSKLVDTSMKQRRSVNATLNFILDEYFKAHPIENDTDKPVA